MGIEFSADKAAMSKQCGGSGRPTARERVENLITRIARAHDNGAQKVERQLGWKLGQPFLAVLYKALHKKRSELYERSFAHVCETGGARR